MTLLSIDSSAKSAAVAVTENDTLLAQSFENNGFTHSETLLPLVDETLKKAGKSIAQIDAFALTNGPGSFTGLRIGCALVKGMAADKPCYPVPTLLALAYNCVDENGIVIPMMDARRAQTYTATYRITDGTVEQLSADRAVAVTEVEEEIISYINSGERVCVLGDGSYLLRPEIAGRVVQAKDPLILGISVAKAAKNIQSVSSFELGLRYLRLSQAEREKKEKENKI